MPICIECRYPVPQLYHTSTSSKSGGGAGGARGGGSSSGGGGGGGGGGAVGATSTSNTSTSTSGGAVSISSGASSFVASALALTPQQPGLNSGNGVASPPDEQHRVQHQHQQHQHQHQQHQHQHQQQVQSPPVRRSRGGGGGEAARRGPAGGDVRLTQCPRCRRFADKYVEHDFVVLFIDLVLVKPQVYRHLLFNRLGSDEDRFDPAITRLGTLLLLFDVYLTWSHIESLPTALTTASGIPRLPILAQYTFYLVLCAAATLAQHVTIRLLARTFASPAAHSTAPSVAGSRWGTPLPASSGAVTPTPTPLHMSSAGLSLSPVASFHSGGGGSSSAAFAPGGHTPHLDGHTHTQTQTQTRIRSPGPNAVSTALFVSSCMQLFPILMVVWKYDDRGGQLARGVSWAVGAQNIEALRILLGGSYAMAAGLVAAGAVARWLAKRIALGAVGLGFAA